jgi:hypothetical protein
MRYVNFQKIYFLGEYKMVNLKSKIFLILLSLFSITLTGCSSENFLEKNLNASEISELFLNSVFKIKVQNSQKSTVSQGSGFILNSNGTFVTNAHVVEDGWYIFADFDGKVTDYEVEWIYHYDAQKDFAIGKLKSAYNRTFTPVEFAKNYDVGTKVFSVGYPQNSYQRIVKSGEILATNYRVQNSTINYIKTSADIDHGSSGGILSTQSGKVIGITSVGFNDGYYGSIPHSYFSNWSSSNISTALKKTPLDYFHPETRVSLNEYNVRNYFRIDVNLVSSNNSFGLISANYSITSTFIAGNNWYLPVIGTKVTISVQIRIDYSYKNSFNYLTSSFSSQYINLEHYSLNSLFSQNYVTRSAYFSFSIGNSSSLKSISDSANISWVVGTIAARS